MVEWSTKQLVWLHEDSKGGYGSRCIWKGRQGPNLINHTMLRMMFLAKKQWEELEVF